MEQSKLLNLGVSVGRLMMTSGAEIYRVEESVMRLLTAYGVQPQVFAIPNCLIVCVNTPSGEPLTCMRRIPDHGVDIEQLDRCNDLCRRLCVQPIDVDVAIEQVQQLETQSNPRYPLPVLLCAYMITAGFFSMFQGGGWYDAPAGALCGLCVGCCCLFGGKFTGANLFFRTLINAAVVGAAATILSAVGIGKNIEPVIIGTLMLMMPGRALTNAMREIMAGDIFSGINRTAEALLTATAIALGCSIPLILGNMI